MSELYQTEMKPKGGMLSVVLQIIVLVAFISAGWFLRGLMPGGGSAAGPGGPGGPGGAAGPVEVQTELVKEGSSQAPQEYIGRVASIQSVDIRAQVSGYIEKVHFVEGSIVQEGDLLFTIEQDQYKARVALAKASLEQAKANLAGANADLNASKATVDSSKADLDRAEKYLDRMQNADKRSIVGTDMDKAVSQEKQARSLVQQGEARVDQAKTIIQQMEALVQKAKADLDLAEIDLAYTEIHSPITGQIGQAMLTKGNYVGPASSALARVVQIDPIRVAFSLSDREYVSFIQEAKKSPESQIQFGLRLPNGTPYEGFGQRDFDDNEMNPQTGTLTVQVRFDNPNGWLIPQSYVQVLLEHRQSAKVPLIPQESIISEKEGDFVFVVDSNDIVEKRSVILGSRIEGYQCVQSGLNVGEKIIIQGLQKVRPGQKVKVALVSAPAKREA